MLFNKNPRANPCLTSFVFFDQHISLNPEEIATIANELLEDYCETPVAQFKLLESDKFAKAFQFLIGEKRGCTIQRMKVQYPNDQLGDGDPNRQLVLDSAESWVVVADAGRKPTQRIADVVHLSIVMQAINRVHSPKAFISLPLGIVRPSYEWDGVIQLLLNNQIVPVTHWVGFDYWEEGVNQITAATHCMDEVFGAPNIEIIQSTRSLDDTMELLELAVCDQLFNGLVHKSTRVFWETKSGIRYKVNYAKSFVDPTRKATQFIEA